MFSIAYGSLFFSQAFEFFTLRSSLSNEQDDDFECEVEEDNLGIGVLTDEPLALVEEVENVDDVRLVDKSGEVTGEILFFLRHVGELLIAEIVHETFSHHVVEVIEHTFLLLSSEGSHHLTPLL